MNVERPNSGTVSQQPIVSSEVKEIGCADFFKVIGKKISDCYYQVQKAKEGRVIASLAPRCRTDEVKEKKYTVSNQTLAGRRFNNNFSHKLEKLKTFETVPEKSKSSLS